MTDEIKINAYRFYDRIALSILGLDVPTIYLRPHEAVSVANYLRDTAKDIADTTFGKSHSGEYTLTLSQPKKGDDNQ